MKTLQQARANFESSASVVPQRYKDGVARADWQGPASSDQAEANFAAGVQDAISNKTRQAKIRGMTNQDWQNNAISKGGTIIGARMKDAAPKYERNFAPIHQAVEAAVGTLPPRTIDPMTNIDNRLKRIVEVQRRAAGKS